MTVDLVPPFVRREDFIEQKGSEYCQSIFLTVQKFEVKQFMETIKSLGGFYIYPTDQTGNIRCETARVRCLNLHAFANEGGAREREGWAAVSASRFGKAVC